MKDLPDTWSTFQWRPPTLTSKWYVLFNLRIIIESLQINMKPRRECCSDAILCTILQEEYLLHVYFAAVGYDSLNSSRPISSPAENPTQIKQMFDTVSYDKVCSLVHVLNLDNGDPLSILSVEMY